MRFSWTKDGKIVTATRRVGITSVDETSTFTIRSVTTEDSGNYTCIASNSISEDKTTAVLTVEGTSHRIWNWNLELLCAVHGSI